MFSRDMPTCISEAGRYGINAMELLINDMVKLGARRLYLKAKAFGGATVLKASEDKDNFSCVGEVNCRFILEFLKNEKIPLIASDLGGEQGRVIHFSFGDFSVYTRKIKKTVTGKLAKRDKDFWKKAIKRQEKEVPEPDIWL